MKAGKNILTRNPTKTGQTVAYLGGDDGHLEAGWWRGRLNANNRIRFIAKTIDGDDVVLDRATGLMWPADMLEAGCNGGATSDWAFAVNYCFALTFAGFSDWRLPNAKELVTLLDFGVPPPTIDPDFFVNTVTAAYWTSTTTLENTSNAYCVLFGARILWDAAKTVITYRLRAARKGL